MTAQNIQRLMNNALVRLPGATQDALQAELFNAVDEFMRGSNAWQQDITLAIPGTDPAGTIYEVVPDTPSTITQLLWVYTVPGNPTSMQRGSPVGATMSVPGELVLNLQPTTAVSIVATVALTVLDPTTRDGYVSFPTWILDRYREALLNGVLSKMMSQPNKPFSNMQFAILHERKFKRDIAAARVEVQRNNNYRSQAWRFPGFVGGSQKGRVGWGYPQ